MKKIITLLSFIFIAALLVIPNLDSRGGRGGGRGGGGRGSYGGGRSMNRSPSMSRSTPSRSSSNYHSRTNRSATARPQTRGGYDSRYASRPGQQRQRQGQRYGGQTRTRNDVQSFFNNRPSERPAGGGSFTRAVEDRPVQRPVDRQPARPADRAVDRSDLQGGYRSDVRNDRLARPEVGNNIRDDIRRDRPHSGDWFNDNFWGRYPGRRPAYWGPNYNGWRYATAVGVGSWLGWNAQPAYYGYYDDSYDNDDDYYSGGSVPTYEQASEAIGSGVTSGGDSSDSSDWMPLGVFAIANKKDVNASPNIYLQLSLNKDGMISGTYYNATTEETYQAEGVVDEKTQRAAWKIVSNDTSPIIETGVYNLTKSEAPAHAYFNEGKTEDLLLVRMEEPANN